MNRWRNWAFALIALILALGYLFAGRSARLPEPPRSVESAPAGRPPGDMGREEADIGTRSLPRSAPTPEQK